MRNVLLIATAACALAACQKTGTTTITTNSQTGEVTQTGDAPQTLNLQPGKWEVTVQVSDLKMANLPKGVNTTPPPMKNTMCMTPEMASKGPGDFLKQAKSDCTATNSTYAGGAIAAELTCKIPGGSTMHSKTTGTYTATSMTTDAAMEMTGATSMSQKIHTEAHRVGECDTAAK